MDVLEEISAFRDILNARRAASPAAPPSTVSANGRKLLAALSLEPTGIDGLARSAGLSAAEAARELLSLELAGLVRAVPGKHYVSSEMSFTTAR